MPSGRVEKDFLITPYEPKEHITDWANRRGSSVYELAKSKTVELPNAYWIGMMPAMRYRDRLFRFVDGLMEQEGTTTIISFLPDQDMIDHGTDGSSVTLLREGGTYQITGSDIGNLADHDEIISGALLQGDTLLNRLRGLDNDTRDLALSVRVKDTILNFPRFSQTVRNLNHYIWGIGGSDYGPTQKEVYDKITAGNQQVIAQWPHSISLWVNVNSPNHLRAEGFKTKAEEVIYTYVAEVLNAEPDTWLWR